METDPFTPGFGRAPVIMAGRSEVTEDFERALRGDVEGRSVLISGARGTGKTVLLTELEAVAADEGWMRIPLHTASTSIVDELRDEAVGILRDLDPDARQTRWTGAGASGFSVSREVVDRYKDEQESLGGLLGRLASVAQEREVGVMLTLDEVQSVNPEQLQEVAQHFQDLTRWGADVAFVSAGIQSGVDDLLDHDKTTFLRRSHRVTIGSVDVGTAAQVVQMTVAETSKSITPEAAVRAGEISQGYPYLIQLTGSRAWRNAGDANTIELEDVERTRSSVIRDMVKNIHGPALRETGGRKMSYLMAMLEDDGPSNVSVIAERMGVDANNQSSYRSRLISDELIKPGPRRGTVEFALPYLREALQDRQQGGSMTSLDSGVGRSRSARRTAGASASHERPSRRRPGQGRGHGR